MAIRALSSVLLAAATLAGAIAAPLAWALPATPSTGGSPTWIFFRDRGSDRSTAWSTYPDSILAPTPRAVARREKARREREALGRSATPLDPAADQELAPHYLEALLATGARLRATSRWLNAASVEADAEALRTIRAFPFVADMEPVASFSTDSAAAKGSAPHDALLPEAGDVEEAGPSYAQLAPIGILEAHALGYQGDGVLIGVLDSGFTLGHEVFRELDVWGSRDFVQGDDNPADERSRVPREMAGRAIGTFVDLHQSRRNASRLEEPLGWRTS
ncbi:MAG: hypothetical protein AAB011_07240 [Candidatus Eisenbacteria bacterium]